MADRASEKHERLASALDRGMAMIHLDARVEGVRVPEYLQHEAHLRLNLSYRFDPPDLTLLPHGVRATLSFGGRRFAVDVPWQAVFAITSHTTQEFWLYLEDMPPEVLGRASDAQPSTAAEQATDSDVAKAAAPKSAEVLPARRHLRVVK